MQTSVSTILLLLVAHARLRIHDMQQLLSRQRSILLTPTVLTSSIIPQLATAIVDVVVVSCYLFMNRSFLKLRCLERLLFEQCMRFLTVFAIGTVKEGGAHGVTP